MKKIFKFNIQLFAEANTQVTTQSSLSAEMKEYYDTELLENVRAQLYFNQFGLKQPLPSRNGKKIEWRKFNSFAKATTPLVEGVTPNGGALTVTNKEAEVKQYGAYTTISDVLDLTAIDDNVLAASDEHSAQAAATIDTLTRNELCTGTNVSYAGSATTINGLANTDIITAAKVNAVVTKLKKSNTPKINGKYIAIIHPSVAEDLRNDASWIDYHKYSSTEEIFNGEIGELHGVRFIESTEAPVIKGENLAGSTRYLAVNGAVSVAGTSITFDGGTVEADALIGRVVDIGGKVVTITDNTATVLTVTPAITALDNAVIAPIGTATGGAVYYTFFFGKDAWGVVDLEGAGLEMIVKPLGSGGSADPLNQRQTVGWKASHAAKILYPERLVNFISASSYSTVDEAN